MHLGGTDISFHHVLNCRLRPRLTSRTASRYEKLRDCPHPEVVQESLLLDMNGCSTWNTTYQRGKVILQELTGHAVKFS
jgi:hypothetical protein